MKLQYQTDTEPTIIAMESKPNSNSMLFKWVEQTEYQTP